MQQIELKNLKNDYQTEEAYKKLRTNIEFSGADKKVIVFTSCTANEENGDIELRFAGSPSHDAALLLDSMILGLEEIEDSREYKSYIDIIFKEV